VIVVGDQRDQRRHDHRRREADQALGRQHHGRGRAERHEHLANTEQRHHDTEDPRRPEALDELGAQHDEARNRQRVHDDACADRGRRHAEGLDHAAYRDGQGGDVERHDRLAERDRDHRHPGFPGLGSGARGSGSNSGHGSSFSGSKPVAAARWGDRSPLSLEGFRDEHVQSQALGQELGDKLPPDAVAGCIKRRREGPEAALARRDGDDPAPNAALAR